MVAILVHWAYVGLVWPIAFGFVTLEHVITGLAASSVMFLFLWWKLREGVPKTLRHRGYIALGCGVLFSVLVTTVNTALYGIAEQASAELILDAFQLDLVVGVMIRLDGLVAFWVSFILIALLVKHSVTREAPGETPDSCLE